MTRRKIVLAGAVLATLTLTGATVAALGFRSEEQNRKAALAAPATFKVDRIVVEKSARRMSLLYKGKVVRRYDIGLGFTPDGHKRKEGDGKTPEGAYTIDARNPKSAYHLSLRVSYPNRQDKAYARKRGFSPGGDIFIHGQPNGTALLFRWLNALGLYNRGDWTHGCIAVTNAEMREIWANVKTGTPIIIKP